MKKPFKFAAVATVAVLPLVMVAPLSAEAAAPAATATVTLKLDGCQATVTGKWSRQPTVPTSVTLHVTAEYLGNWAHTPQTSPRPSFGTSGSYKYTFPEGQGLDPDNSLHEVRGALILNDAAEPVAVSATQWAYCVPAGSIG